MTPKLIRFALAALAFAPSLVAQQHLSVFPPPGESTVVKVVSEDEDTAVTCRYIEGSAACASIAVDAGTGDYTFTEGPCGAEVATDTFECPVAGALGGVIDVSNAACNTFGELVDIVNAPGTGWRCMLANALRTDSTIDTTATIAATQATDPDGLKLKFDSSVALFSNVTLAPAGWDNYTRLAPGGNSAQFIRKPWAGSQSALLSVQSKSTYGAGSSSVSIIAVDRTFAAAGSETATTVWPATAAGATTVNKVFGYCDTPATGCDPAWGPIFVCPLGQQCIFRVTNTDQMSVNVTGVNARYRLTGGAQ